VRYDSQDEGWTVAKTLYADFLDDMKSNASESTWEKVAMDLSMEMHQSGEWYRWAPRAFADGTPMERDGNPFSMDVMIALARRSRLCSMHPLETQWISALG
jgi:hypothetical protein